MRPRVAFQTLMMLVLMTTGQAVAQINVFLEYSNFETRLDEATSSAGVANFSTSEVNVIKSNIFANLNNSFSGYAVNFTETNPGGDFETLTFSLTGGGYGLADRIDFGNLVKTDVARVFTASFDDFLDAGDSRAQQILELSNSLSGTAAHEVGHNVGLEHRDCYGISTLPPAGPGGGGPTGGLQNLHIMATGSTGINTNQREVPRSFSDLSHVKLEFADGVNPNLLSRTDEQAAAHGTSATAQQVEFSGLNIMESGYDQAAVVDGRISAIFESDFYKFDVLAGEFVTMQVISSVLPGSFIDSVITLFDTDGSTQLIENDETEYDIDSINPGNNFYSSDSSIYNFQAATTGTYFLEVASFSNSDLGDYHLLLAATSLAVVPEPSTLGLSILAFATLLGRRRGNRRTH